MRDVLIVDYDPELREQASHVLNGGVYSLTFASDGVEALKLVKQKRFDLILVDLLMPGALNGIQILQGMQRHAPSSPLVVMSDRNGHQELETAMRYGAKEVLLKPVHLELMKAVADRLTGGLVRGKEGAAEAIAAATVKQSLDGSVPAAAAEQRTDKTALPGPVDMTNQPSVQAGYCRSRLFSGLSDASLQDLMTCSKIMTLEEGQEYSFDACQTMIIVCKGVARCWYKGLLISVLERGDSMGEGALFSRTGESLPMILDGNEELEVLLFSRKALRTFYQKQNSHHLLHFAARVVQNFSGKLVQLYDEMSQARRAQVRLEGAGGCYPAMEEYAEERDEWIC